MRTKENNIEQYARLIVEVGVNIQKDQYLMITAPIQTAYFARALTKCAYEVGAKKVYVDYVDEELNKVQYMHAPDEAFLEYPEWVAEGKKKLAEKNCAFISISASNPDLLKDVDPKRIATMQKTAGMALEAFRRYTQNGDVAWCVASIPTVEWAHKVFPEATDDKDAVDKLWDKIFIATRIYEEDPVASWKAHTENLKEKTDFLTAKKFTKLHYIAPGTDLYVELPKGHIWQGGGSYNKAGTYYVANMPTEEIFTMPSKYGVDGKLSSTKPLSYGGNLIDRFVLHFEKGRIVDFSAEEGYETLKGLVETDEGSHYLGEVAIVPDNSPVSNTNTIFFNTLFDENASCHFAIGSAYPDTIEGGTKMTKEELEAAGANTSLTHVDFMVGGKNLTIEGVTEDGEALTILKDGNWAI
ncbi:aminopeptidase [Niameybacter massiliensis]|uniref:Aminopeptidase n=1 Tax=Holtiella tumoricola TaxID=3018743 RepID=A0AA42J2L7_9FIRM|nr:aminopeptidase [Holtiella tumoricola]MDA3733864.1 aminopeptidase [Holtiella tumoricola]